MPSDDVNRVKELETKLAETREATRTQLLQTMEACIADLRELGYDYAVIEKSRRLRTTVSDIATDALVSAERRGRGRQRAVLNPETVQHKEQEINS